MTDTLELAELRELFRSAPESPATRVVAIGVSFAMLAVVLWLVRRRALREQYTPIFVLVALGMAFFSVWMDALHWVTRAIGAWTPRSTVLFLGEVCLLAIALHFAVRLSRSGVRVKNLVQENALLRARIEDVERRLG